MAPLLSELCLDRKSLPELHSLASATLNPSQCLSHERSCRVNAYMLLHECRSCRADLISQSRTTKCRAKHQVELVIARHRDPAGAQKLHVAQLTVWQHLTA